MMSKICGGCIHGGWRASFLIPTEQEMEVIDGQCLGKVFFTKYVIGECTFLLLQMADFFLDTVFNE